MDRMWNFDELGLFTLLCVIPIPVVRMVFQQERLDIEEKYSSLQEEVAGKTKKLKKVWTMLMQAKSEVSTVPSTRIHKYKCLVWPRIFGLFWFFDYLVFTNKQTKTKNTKNNIQNAFASQASMLGTDEFIWAKSESFFF